MPSTLNDGLRALTKLTATVAHLDGKAYQMAHIDWQWLTSPGVLCQQIRGSRAVLACGASDAVAMGVCSGCRWN